MAESYYQGEDISITIEVYNEESLTTKQDLTDIEADLLLCTANNAQNILASTDSDLDGVDIEIERIDSGQLKLTIPAATSATLDEGNATIEIRLRDTTTGTSTISVNSSISIESSKIGKLT